MRRTCLVALLALTVTALAGCGQKGPLVMPTPASAPAPASTASSPAPVSSARLPAASAQP